MHFGLDQLPSLLYLQDKGPSHILWPLSHRLDVNLPAPMPHVTPHKNIITILPVLPRDHLSYLLISEIPLLPSLPCLHANRPTTKIGQQVPLDMEVKPQPCLETFFSNCLCDCSTENKGLPQIRRVYWWRSLLQALQVVAPICFSAAFIQVTDRSIRQCRSWHNQTVKASESSEYWRDGWP